MIKPVFKVLAALDLSTEAGRRKLGGIYRFLGEGHDWDLELIRSQKEFTGAKLCTAAKSGVQGLLIAVPETAAQRALHAKLAIPTAFIDFPDASTLKSFPLCVFINEDNHAIGSTAAQHLLAQGTTNGFGYAAASDSRPWNQGRHEGFAAQLARNGRPCDVFERTETRPRGELVAWLKALPKPAGVMTAFDDVARRILAACADAGLRVPQDVSVIGVGNDEVVCDHVRPTLTSVAPDFEEEGYRAARELQAMMLRPRVPSKREFLCPIKDVAERGSTLHTPNAGLLVQRAMDFIEKNALKNITAADVAAHLHVSRRLADLRFREVRKTSMLATILDIRLGEVKRLLAETDLPVAEIAERCGCNPASLKNLFRRHFGVSMREWRKANVLTRFQRYSLRAEPRQDRR